MVKLSLQCIIILLLTFNKHDASNSLYAQSISKSDTLIEYIDSLYRFSFLVPQNFNAKATLQRDFFMIQDSTLNGITGQIVDINYTNKIFPDSDYIRKPVSEKFKEAAISNSINAFEAKTNDGEAYGEIQSCEEFYSVNGLHVMLFNIVQKIIIYENGNDIQSEPPEITAWIDISKNINQNVMILLSDESKFRPENGRKRMMSIINSLKLF